MALAIHQWEASELPHYILEEPEVPQVMVVLQFRLLCHILEVIHQRQLEVEEEVRHLHIIVQLRLILHKEEETLRWDRKRTTLI